MNFRNKDLKEIFDERYQANHNKELQENAKNNKKIWQIECLEKIY